MDDAPSASTEAPASQSPGTIRWFVACLVVTIALSIVAAHVPGRVRLIVLFSVGFGLLIGWIVVQLSEKLKLNCSRKVMADYAALLTLAGLIGSTVEIHRLDAKNRKPSANEMLAVQMAEQMKEKMPSAEKGKSNSLNSLSEALDTSFRRHLARRVRQLGDMQPPLPELIWSAELLAGMVAGYWIANRLSKRNPTSHEPNPDGV